MSDRHMKDALESIARRGVSENTNLWPDISARLLKRKSFMQTLRARPLVAALITLLILLALSGVVYALGRSLGYIPGIGMVDQSSPIRVVTEPVSQTHHGITVTVTQVILDASQTIITFKVEGVSPSAYQNLYPNSDNFCTQPPVLALNDHSILDYTEANAVGNPLEQTWRFKSISTSENAVVFTVPCVVGLKKDIAPQPFVLHLNFADAPAQLTQSIQPVVTIPSPMSGKVEEFPYGIVMVLEKAVALPDGNILYGKFVDSDKQYLSMVDHVIPSVLDSVGNAVEVRQVDPQQGAVGPYIFPFAYKTTSPLPSGSAVFSVESIEVEVNLQVPVRFQVDVGQNPQVGQEWKIDQDVEVAGHKLHIDSVKAISQNTDFGYTVTFIPTDKDIVYLMTEIENPIYPAAMVQGGGGLMGNGAEQFITSVSFYEGGLPSGVLDMVIGEMDIILHGPWKFTFQP